MTRLSHSHESVHAAYGMLDAVLCRPDYSAFLALLAHNHETIHPDERRVTRQQLERAAFPFDGLRYRESRHTPARLRFGPTGCAVWAEGAALITVGDEELEEELLLQDLWIPEDLQWKLRRRIVMRQRRCCRGQFTLLEHPLYCQFGHCQTDKATWKEPRPRS